MQLGLALAACVLALGCPGFVIALGLRLRGLWLVAGTPAISLTAIVSASVLAPLLGMEWSFLPVLLISVAAAVAAWLVTHFVRPARPRPIEHSEWRFGSAAAVTIAAVILGARLMFAVGSPELFAQSFDNVFHLNAVQFVLESKTASPFNLQEMTTVEGTPTVYPSGWHAVVALVVQLSGVSIPIASNALLALTACAVWPTGAILLTRACFGTGTVTTLAAGVLCAGVAAYPMFLIPYMGTYPLFLSVALVPVCIAAMMAIGKVGRLDLGPLAAGLLLVACIPGVVGVHPSALAMLSVLSVPVAGAVAGRAIVRHRSGRARRLIGALSVLYFLAMVAVVTYLRPGGLQDPAAPDTVAQALGEGITGAIAGSSIPVISGALTLVGVVACVRTRSASALTAVGLWVMLLAIYVMAHGGDAFLRALFTGSWYGDPNRIAAFVPIGIVPLAAFGASRVWIRIKVATESRARLTRFAGVVAMLSLTALAVSTTLSASVRSVDTSMRSTFTPTDDPFSALVALSEDGRKVIDFIGKNVPQEDLIAGNPWKGSSFIYALTSRHVLLPAINMGTNASIDAFMDSFAQSAEDGPGCTAARDLDVKWVVDIPQRNALPQGANFDGVAGLDESSNVELAYRSGNASLYRVTGCGL